MWERETNLYFQSFTSPLGCSGLEPHMLRSSLVHMSLGRTMGAFFIDFSFFFMPYGKLSHDEEGGGAQKFEERDPPINSRRGRRRRGDESLGN